MLDIGIGSYHKSLQKECLRIAEKFSIDFVNLNINKSPTYLLLLDEAKLSLVNTREKAQKPFFIDFCQGKMARRLQISLGKRDLLAKAIGIKKLNYPSIIDVTAGLGRDGILLAMAGCSVTLLERNVILYLLLQDGLNRFAKGHPEIHTKLNYQLMFTDAREYLKHCKAVDVIYLDPMFPERTKRALVKKDMQLLHEIVGVASDADELFELSLRKAKKRVVVKRPLHAKHLTEKKPDFSYKGKTIRYDVTRLKCNG